MPGMMDYISDALRGKKEKEEKPKLKPLEQRRRGYQLYVQEQKAMGETPVSYEEWIKIQE